MHLAESGEMYLETIYLLSQRNEYVISRDLADEMHFSKPSISRAVGLLKDNGYLTVDGNGHLYLTESGLSIATKIYERHTILTKLFVMLGVDEKVAVEDACKIEHDISDETFEAIKRHLAEHTDALHPDAPHPDASHQE